MLVQLTLHELCMHLTLFDSFIQLLLTIFGISFNLAVKFGLQLVNTVGLRLRQCSHTVL